MRTAVKCFALLILYLVCAHAYGQRPAARPYQYPGLLPQMPAPAPAWPVAVRKPAPVPKPVAPPRTTRTAGLKQRAGTARLLAVSATRLGVRELTGNNDGPLVEEAQRLAGARVGVDPWCGCERYLWNYRCGRPSPKGPAAARNWSPANSPRTFFIRRQRGKLDSVKIGDTVTFYYANLGRVGHVGMVVAEGRPVRAGRPPRELRIRAGNTGRGGGRDGAGVHDVDYAGESIYAAATW